MFTEDHSNICMLGLEDMHERRIPVLVLHPPPNWYEQLYHFGVSSGGDPHERGDPVLVCRVLVRNNDLGGFYVPIPESPVERCGSDCRSFPSHVQGGPLPLPCDPLVQQSQAQSYHQHLSPALVEVPPDLGHAPTGSRSHEGCLII